MTIKYKHIKRNMHLKQRKHSHLFRHSTLSINKQTNTSNQQEKKLDSSKDER